MNLTTDQEILEAVKAAATEFNMSPSAFIGFGRAIAEWRKYALIPTFGPFPHLIDEVEISPEVYHAWPEWVSKFVPLGSKWERLHWPDGTFTIRLVDHRGLVEAAIRLPSGDKSVVHRRQPESSPE